MLDLSPGNVDFAKAKAAELNLSIDAICGDARYADKLVNGSFDAVLLMGPLYHLPEEKDRNMAVSAALNLLKPGGTLYVSFISSYAAVWDFLGRHTHTINESSEQKYYSLMVNDTEFSGISFTQTHFIRPADVKPFMAKFPVEQLHLLGSESILGLREAELAVQPPEVIKGWIDFAEKVCEREDLISMAEHFLYVCKKL